MLPDDRFYLTGLGLLMQGVKFTEAEHAMLSFLCKHAARGDDEYLAAIRLIKSDLGASKQLDRLKDTLRSLGKGPILEAYYDRTPSFQR